MPRGTEKPKTYRYFQPSNGWVEGAGLAWANEKARLGYLVEEFDEGTLSWVAFSLLPPMPYCTCDTRKAEWAMYCTTVRGARP